MKKFTIKHYAFSLVLSLFAMGPVSAMDWYDALKNKYSTIYKTDYNYSDTNVETLRSLYYNQIEQIGQNVAGEINQLKQGQKAGVYSLTTMLKSCPKADDFYYINAFDKTMESGSKSIMTVVNALIGLNSSENLDNAQELAETLKNDFLPIFTQNTNAPEFTEIPAVKEFFAQIELLSQKTPEIKQRVVEIEVKEQEIGKDITVSLEQKVELEVEKDQVIAEDPIVNQELPIQEKIIALRAAIEKEKFFTNPKENKPLMDFVIAPLAEFLQKISSTDEAAILNEKNGFELAMNQVIANLELIIENSDFINMKSKQKEKFCNAFYAIIANRINTFAQEKNSATYKDAIDQMLSGGNDAPMTKLDNKLNELAAKVNDVKIENKPKNLALKNGLVATAATAFAASVLAFCYLNWK